MLRIKRSVRDKYSTQSSFNLPPDADTTTAAVAAADPMAQLQKDVQFVRGNVLCFKYLGLVAVLVF